MTTSVIVEAHCSEDTEVQVVIGVKTVTLQNGEKHQDYVHGDKEITVREVKKPDISQAAKEGFDEINSHDS